MTTRPQALSHKPSRRGTPIARPGLSRIGRFLPFRDEDRIGDQGQIRSQLDCSSHGCSSSCRHFR